MYKHVCFDLDFCRYSCNLIPTCSFLHVLHRGLRRGALKTSSSHSQSPFPRLKGFLVLCICNVLSTSGGFEPAKVSVEQKRSLNASASQGGCPPKSFIIENIILLRKLRVFVVVLNILLA